jgi:hypothetical protein
LVAHSLAVVTPDVTLDAELAALDALDAAFVADVEALLADVEAALADDAAFDALVAAAEAEEAALLAEVEAEAASTSSVHLAASVLVLIGCEPVEVCWTIHCQMLLLVVSLTMSRT